MSEERKKINYTVACVSEFASRHNMKQKAAFQFLFKYKAIEFLKENYDIEHTLSFDEAVEDMLIICQKNGGVLTNQYSFHSEKALSLLKKAGVWHE